MELSKTELLNIKNVTLEVINALQAARIITHR